MTSSPVPGPAPAPAPVKPGQLAWLEGELRQWQDLGLLEAPTADAIRARYVAVRRFSLVRLLLGLGVCFFGVGVLWLVAANLDRLTPGLRFTLVVLLWLGLTAAAEAVAGRRPRWGGSAVVGAARVLAALSFGAVVFQAAQSLQVPAYEPRLLGIWGLGVLLYAYAVAAVSPLLVGLSISTAWFVWHVADSTDSGMGFVAALLVGGLVAASVAVLHSSRLLPRFAVPWREVGALLVLIGLFAAALPFVTAEDFRWPALLTLGLVVAAVAAAAALLLADREGRLELVAPVAALGAGLLLVLWDPGVTDASEVTGTAYLHAFVSVAVYLAAAGWYAVLGTLRDTTRLTVLATGALVVFTTVQAFAVFAPIISGATLFLLVGAVLVGSGFVVDRGRRHLVATIEGGVS
ncbi:DUF2157 domain-containing protein [Knoellia sp. 3-2P3]|uniref:DUF2157 domain-containing protein n=1 Tax=unclassified Knoellia TaxID=2618719 RepID=UPI0023DA2B54|nr:DUF2157 domain-containing protein [Knoellia sp. 3-2P3]MDF2094309.1 DUF2157 domain-containing protein [Knoellia sp. 3-2P3]